MKNRPIKILIVTAAAKGSIKDKKPSNVIAIPAISIQNQLEMPSFFRSNEVIIREIPVNKAHMAKTQSNTLAATPVFKNNTAAILSLIHI